MQSGIDTKIPYFIFQENDKFVAYSPAIDLSTCGETEKEARERFAEAARIFFDEIIKMGTLEDVLTECGWKKVPNRVSQLSWVDPCPESLLSVGRILKKSC